jgi:predicted nucleotidyltransferase
LDDIVTRAAPLVSHWASGQSKIGQVWFFGSRVRGTHRADSDLDVAIVMNDPSRSKGDRFGEWIALSAEWERQIQALVEVPIDLDVGDPDISTEVVAPAIQCEGIKIFDRAKLASTFSAELDSEAKFSTPDLNR